MGFIKTIKVFDTLLIGDDIELHFPTAPGSVKITVYIKAPESLDIKHIKCSDEDKLKEREFIKYKRRPRGR